MCEPDGKMNRVCSDLYQDIKDTASKLEYAKMTLDMTSLVPFSKRKSRSREDVEYCTSRLIVLIDQFDSKCGCSFRL